MRLACLPIALVLLGLAPVAAPQPVSPGDASPLTVVSLNLAMREDVDVILAELTEIGAGPEADIILLQEVVQRHQREDVGTQLARRMRLEAAYRPSFAIDGERWVGLALLSRAPARDLRVLDLKQFGLTFRTRNRIAMGAIVDTKAGAVRVYNLHLDTRINIEQRLEQLGAVARDVESSTGPTVIGGDFNSNNNQWLFHVLPVPLIGRQAAGLQRFMAASGFQSAFALGTATHDVLGMQLDWLFLRGLRAARAAVRPVQLSDHHALVAALLPGD